MKKSISNCTSISQMEFLGDLLNQKQANNDIYIFFIQPNLLYDDTIQTLFSSDGLKWIKMGK